jgi:glycosyltransferase involved in cell wall biosynthesis
MPQRKVLFLTRMGELSAAARYRATQFIPALEEAGFRCTVRPLFPDRYLRRTYGSGSRRRALLAMAPEIGWALARRWLTLARDAPAYDVVHLQYEALPYLPFFFERGLFDGRTRVVVDFDDAFHVGYEQHRNPAVRALLGPKISRVVGASRHVIVANGTLAAWAERLNPSVTLIANAIDLRRYPAGPRPAGGDGIPTIVWIGTPVTAPYLRLVEGPLRALRERHPFRLKVIGAPDFRMEGVDVVARPWSEATEVEELAGSDIGIMPLPDDDWARGKSALKLLQYMAAGIAAMGSAVGANCEVVDHGANGLLARGPEEWTAGLARLIEDPAGRARMAAAGRASVEEHHSLQASAPRFVEVIRQVAES